VEIVDRGRTVDLLGPSSRASACVAAGRPFKRSKLRRTTYVNSDVTVVVNLGVCAQPLPDGLVVLSSVADAMVIGRLTTDAAISLTSWFLPPSTPPTT